MICVKSDETKYWRYVFKISLQTIKSLQNKVLGRRHSYVNELSDFRRRPGILIPERPSSNASITLSPMLRYHGVCFEDCLRSRGQEKFRRCQIGTVGGRGKRCDTVPAQIVVGYERGVSWCIAMRQLLIGEDFHSNTSQQIWVQHISTRCTFSSILLVDGRSARSSSSTHFRPSLKDLFHLKTAAFDRLLHPNSFSIFGQRLHSLFR